MFRRYIRHRQCDGYESLQLKKHACYNVQYTLLKQYTTLSMGLPA